MAHLNDPIWKTHANRLLGDVIQFDPKPKSYDSDPEFEEDSTFEDRYIAIPHPNEHLDPLPTPLTGRTSDPVSAAFIEHVAILPKYPRTHDAGFAYVVNLENIKPHQVKDSLKSVQYSFHGKGAAKNVYNAYLGCTTEKKRYTCSSVKCCEFLDPELTRMGHLHADEALFTTIA
ncbi:uncharacterized protein N7498_007833 [Penicillium cinerascens]|uniref:Uncharacterized protein n=1 Tax=Penicillium cinerascens TaxID=70096 RepID=A0A9W9MD42_9EURO|nr:uncharacterized protein N7498_007833 [Penicillium cinerascens]KAJ5198716.1 hypothetical protein N7498_007833 [Penicillium cinerascens]